MTDHDMLMIWEVYKRIDEWTGAMIVFALFIFCTVAIVISFLGIR